jgi:group I intron endonuclease
MVRAYECKYTNPSNTSSIKHSSPTLGISSGLNSLPFIISTLTFAKTYRRSYSTLSVKPVKVYESPYLQRAQINKELRGLSGIYRWVNKESGKSYVGSAVILPKRLSKYFSKKYLSVSSSNMLICKALVKYGYTEFKLEILEFTARDTLIVREQYFLDKLHPEYNILKFSGSCLGYKHKEATKKWLSERKKKIVMDEPTRELIRISLLGRIISPEAIEKKRLSDRSRQSVTITNLQTGEMKHLPYLSAASSFLGITRYMLSNYMLNNTACKGYNIVMKGKAQPLASGYNSTQPITLTHKETGEIL